MPHGPPPLAPPAALAARARLAALAVEEARQVGFHRAGVVTAGPAPRHDAYVRWIEAGHAGAMAYLADPAAIEARRDVRALLPSARSAVVAALAHGVSDPARPASAAGDAPAGFVARYARGADYHAVVRERLHLVADRLAAAAGVPVVRRACVDTAPLLERALAEAAGLGFVGKNGLLIAPGLGSYLVLGVLLLDLDLAPTARAPAAPGETAPAGRCGACRACLDACPTGAFAAPRVLDARRCVSYLTIELGGPIPTELRPGLGTRVFGCDVCQEVCPFNAAVTAAAEAPPGGGRADRAPPAPELEAAGRGHGAPALASLARLGAAAYRRLVKRTALRRVSRAQLARNACVALGNAGDPGAARPALRAALRDAHPLVRAHAAWALGRIGDAEALAARLAEEPDAGVRAEIDRALAAATAAASARAR